MTDGVGVTERQFEYSDDDSHRNQEPNHPIGHQEAKDPVGHQYGAAQRVVNDSVTVTGRGGHDEAVIARHAKEEKHLCGTQEEKWSCSLIAGPLA